ncbi:MAG: protein kinase [Verrucomicrobiae bacterium]|nr:protein kinase [Verrucomicrobiae bacterium]
MEPSRGGRYEIRGVVARGGMGVIYAVLDRELNRQIAMKVIGTNLAGTEPVSLDSLPPAWVDRFVEEAQITAQLDHPHIVPVHEIGVDPHGRIYFTMKLVKGRALNEIFALARDRLEGWTLLRAVHVIVQACQAVAHAHEHRVIHRDLKPQNILVARLGEVYVMDWGLARRLDRGDLYNLRPSDRSKTPASPSPQPGSAGAESAANQGSPLLTVDGTVLGTPAYMSPEHAEGRIEDIGPASDVYSLGAILYELLTGHPPFLGSGQARTPKAVIEAVRSGPPDPLGVAARHQPAELLAICSKAMNRKAPARYPSATELAEDLQAWIEGRVVRAHRTGALAELKAWILRNRLAAFSQAAAAMVIVGILLAVAAHQHRTNRQLSAQVYAATTAEATLQLEAGRHAASARLLANCRPELRGWEWWHLRTWAHSWRSIPLCQEPAGLTAVAANAGQGWFVTAGEHQPLRLRSLSDGRERRTLGLTNAAFLAVSPAGTVLAAATRNGEVTVWQMPAGELRAQWTTTSPIRALALSPDEIWLGVATGDGQAQVWTLQGRQEAGTSVAVPITDLDFTGAATLILGDDAGGLWRWEPGSNPLLDRLGHQPAHVIAVAANPSKPQVVSTGRRLAGGSGLRLWNVEARSSHDLFVPAGLSEFWSTAFDATGRRLLACAYFGQVVITDVDTGRLDAVIALDGRSEAGAVFLDDSPAILTWAASGEVLRLERPHPDHLRLTGPPGQLRTLRFTPDRLRLRVASLAGELLEWDLHSASLTRRIQFDNTLINAIAQTADASRLYAAGTAGRLHGVNAASGEVEFQTDTADGQPAIWWLDLSPDERRLVAGCTDGTLRVLDIATRRWTRLPIPAHAREVEGVRFSANGSLLASCSNDGSVALWRTDNWSNAWRQTNVSSTTRCLAFSPDGTRLVHGAGDGATHVRYVRDGALALPPLTGHDGRVLAATYSPDGTRIFTGGTDGTMRVWNAGTGQLLLSLQVTTQSPVWDVAVSRDGTHVAASDGEGTVTVWFGAPSAP